MFRTHARYSPTFWILALTFLSLLAWLWGTDLAIAEPLNANPPPQLPAALAVAGTMRDTNLSGLEQNILVASNRERHQTGQTPLLGNETLAEVAAAHSRDMVARRFFAHDNPDGLGSAERTGLYVRSLFGLVSENLAMMSDRPNLAEEFIQGWMHSPGHKANLLRPDSTDLGVGCAQTIEGGMPTFYCTQLFMNVYASLAQPLPATVNAGQAVEVWLSPHNHQPLPTRLLQVDARGWETASVVLQPQNGAAVGRLILQGPPAQYRMQVEVPDTANAQRFWIIPGPFVTVR
jgi:uncharacterized protein YkwD